MTTKTNEGPTLGDFADITDIDKATDAYLDALAETGQWRTELRPIARARMASLKRARVRALEDKVFGGNGDGSGGDRLAVDLLVNRYELITEAFYVPSLGTYVKWLEATPAQHRERAEMQRRLAGTCLVDAERHEQAAALIEEFGCTNLAELPEDVTVPS